MHISGKLICYKALIYVYNNPITVQFDYLPDGEGSLGYKEGDREPSTVSGRKAYQWDIMKNCRILTSMLISKTCPASKM